MSHPTIERPAHHRAHRTQLQRRAAAALADHPYRLELTGALDAISWPSICASCGTGTAERLTVRKTFSRPRFGSSRTRYRGITRHTIAGAKIPYCHACIERHRSLTPPRSALGDLWRMLWPVLIPMLGAGYFLMLTLRIALAEQARGGLSSKYVWGVPALFAAILLWCVVIGWWSSRAARVEKQTEVTRACDFSDDVSWLWERERRIYAMREQRFAQALADANRDRIWNGDDDRRAQRRTLAVLAVAGVIGAAVWAYVVFVL